MSPFGEWLSSVVKKVVSAATGRPVDPSELSFILDDALIAKTVAEPRFQKLIGGLFLGEGEVPQDPGLAARWWRRAAEGGDAQAQFSLAVLLGTGRGVAQDLPAAVSWLKKSAEQGFTKARHSLGCRHFYGQGTERDPVAAEQAWMSAADAGFMPSHVKLGMLYNCDSRTAAKAMEWFRKPADQGFAEAQFQLGLAFLEGRGVEKSLDEAEHWLGRAADLAWPAAFTPLATLLVSEDFSRRDPVRAETLFKLAADQGDAEAAFSLGMLYLKGSEPRTTDIGNQKELGLPNSPNEAVIRLEQAAARNHVRAMVELGKVLYEGRGVPANPEKATIWWRKAADHEDEDAFLLLISHALNGDSLAPGSLRIRLLEVRVRRGHAPSQHLLGKVLLDGLGGHIDPLRSCELLSQATLASEPKALDDLRRAVGVLLAQESFAESVPYLQVLADAGDAISQYHLAVSYRVGRGVASDPRKAAALFRKAGEQGMPEALNNLANMLLDAEGVPGDATEAVALFRRAADLGLVHAVATLGYCYVTGTGVPPDIPQGILLLESAAAKNNPKACFNLGMIQYQGKAGPRNRSKALIFFKRALAGGEKAASEWIDRIMAEGRPVGD